MNPKTKPKIGPDLTPLEACLISFLTTIFIIVFALWQYERHQYLYTVMDATVAAHDAREAQIEHDKWETSLAEQEEQYKWEVENDH